VDLWLRTPEQLSSCERSFVPTKFRARSTVESIGLTTFIALSLVTFVTPSPRTTFVSIKSIKTNTYISTRSMTGSGKLDYAGRSWTSMSKHNHLSGLGSSASTGLSSTRRPRH